MSNTLVDDEPVLRVEGSAKGRRRGIVDLVLSRRVPTPYATDLHHLVIELKAPKQPLKAEDTLQIKSYAYAVSGDERFKGTNTTWRFWLVGNDLTDFVENELKNDEGRGILQRTPDGRFMIAVRRWSELIHEARARLQFVQKELNYEVNRDDALAKLRTTYAHLLGDEESAPPMQASRKTRTRRMPRPATTSRRKRRRRRDHVPTASALGTCASSNAGGNLD